MQPHLIQALASKLIPVSRWKPVTRQLGPSTQVVETGLSHNPAVGCHYFLPDLWTPSQLQTISALWPVPNCSAWWQS